MVTNLIQPSFNQGFARNGIESENPGLWKGKVGHWVTSLGVQGNVLRDISGYGNDGAFTNAPTWVVGTKGHALDFNGSSNYINAGNSPALQITDEITVLVWVKMATTGTGPDLRIISKKATWFDASGFELTYNPSTDRSDFLTEGGNLARSDSLDLGTSWHQLGASVANGTTGMIYADGLDVTTFDNTTGLNADTQAFHIGKQSGGADYFDGQIADVRIYNRVLSPQEIWQLYIDTLADLRINRFLYGAVPVVGGRTTKNTDAFPLGDRLGMGFRLNSHI